MASLLVLIEPIGDVPHPASLEVLGQARRIATSLGATVYAVAPCVRAPMTGQEVIIEALSAHGADKVVLAASPSCHGPLRWGTHGAALQAACDLIHPSLVLAADTQGARDLGGRLAAHLGAAWLADAWIEPTKDSLLLWEGSGDRALQLVTDGDGGIEFPVFALVPPGRYAFARGEEEAEVEVLEAPAAQRDFTDEGERGAAPRAVVLGAPAAAGMLASALDGVTATEEQVPLAIVLGGGGESFGETRAIARAALGPGASSCPAAHYAVEGDPDVLALALATDGEEP